MLDQLQALAAGLAALASPTQAAFLLAGILAMTGIGLLRPRRRAAALPAPAVATHAPGSAVPSSGAEGQWGRLSGLIETGVNRADEAGRAHDAAGNALNALEHDLEALRDDLARIEDGARRGLDGSNRLASPQERCFRPRPD